MPSGLIGWWLLGCLKPPQPAVNRAGLEHNWQAASHERGRETHTARGPGAAPPAPRGRGRRPAVPGRRRARALPLPRLLLALPRLPPPPRPPLALPRLPAAEGPVLRQAAGDDADDPRDERGDRGARRAGGRLPAA